jgi:hypothetical protein
MSDVPPESLSKELPAGDLERLVKHLEQEEVEAQKARLSSVESLELWVSRNPALQQPGLVEAISVYGPALLEFLRRALGL